MELPRDVYVHLGPGANLDSRAFLDPAKWHVKAFVVDSAENNGDNIPVITPRAWAIDRSNVPNVPGALDPDERRRLVDYIAANGGEYANVEPRWAAGSPRAHRDDTAMVFDGVALGPFARVGRFSIVMSPISIGHDSVVGDFVTCYPAAGISGFVSVGNDVVIENGAVIYNGSADRMLRIGNGAIVRAGAVITRDVPPAAVMMGNPARRIE